MCSMDTSSFFFESVSAPVLSGTQLPRFPDQVRLFGGSFGLLIHLLDVWRPSH